MTPPPEIKALEEDFKTINECGPAWPALDGLLKAMKVYLKLLKGEHETLVIVPRPVKSVPGDKITIIDAQGNKYVYELDAGWSETQANQEEKTNETKI